MALVVKNPPANAGDIRDTGSIPRWGRSPEGGHGNPLWYFCLENPMDRGAWQVTVRGVSKRYTETTYHTCTLGIQAALIQAEGDARGYSYVVLGKR